MNLFRIRKLYDLNFCGLRVLIPGAALDALGDTPNVGTRWAGAVDHYHGSLVAVGHEVGGLVVGDQEDTQEEDVGCGGHSFGQEDKVQMTLWLLID